MKILTIDEILAEKSDFLKGVKFHSFVDEKRDYFYEENGVYTPGTSDKVFIYSLKVLEDDILYSRLSIRQKFIEFFTAYKFPSDDINEETIKKWKGVLCNYLSLQPCTNSRRDFIL
jgi:hypothetical protein